MPVKYVPKYREYGFSVAGGSALQQMYYCPFCGTKFPGDLSREFFDRLDALGLEIEDPQVPEAMRSDAWWRAEEAEAGWVSRRPGLLGS